MCPFDPDTLAAQLAPVLFRTDYVAPGFALIDRGTDHDAPAFRAELVALAEALGREYERQHGEPLLFHSVSRFSQQAQTRPHRDGGPDASILVLGYEPSEVLSRIELLDYSRAAFDRGMTPTAYLDCCNPAFGGNVELLRHYTVEVMDFTPSRYQILIVNNSQLPHDERQRGMLGLLHHAIIEAPRPARDRFINSLLLGILDSGLSAEQLRNFIAEGTAAAR